MQTVTVNRNNKHTARSVAETDMELVQRTRAGDVAAFELIMRRHNQRLFRIARSIVGNDADAEDVLQETYLRAYSKLYTFRGPIGFASWLGKIALNEARGRVRNSAPVISLDSYRTAKETEETYRLIDSMPTDHPDPERLTASRQLRKLLENAIDALPENFSTVFMLRVVEGLTVEETAEVLSIKPETVKTRLHRARQQVKQSLGATLGELMPTPHQFDGKRCDRIVESVLNQISTKSTGLTPPGSSNPFQSNFND